MVFSSFSKGENNTSNLIRTLIFSSEKQEKRRAFILRNTVLRSICFKYREERNTAQSVGH
jgi:hypothetical protein